MNKFILLLIGFIFISGCDVQNAKVDQEDINNIAASVDEISKKTLSNIDAFVKVEKIILGNNNIFFDQMVFESNPDHYLSNYQEFQNLYDLGVEAATISKNNNFVVFRLTSKIVPLNESAAKRFTIFLTRANTDMHIKTVSTCDEPPQNGYCNYKLLNDDWVITYVVRLVK
ncbi:hypothetical protein [Aliiglaciecola litoralis]|uniref:SnoaL-like domain-containing protein n=1 Tax=Aliiglaciecola litoralis TaxID=582857 RepID=A0ABN1LDH9_9ALTE